MNDDIFRISDDKEIDGDSLKEYINQNDALANGRYATLWSAYVNDYAIYSERAKPSWKPDNRISANWARYVADTFIGFSYGIPVKVESEDEATSAFIGAVDDATNADDVLCDWATMTAVFGRAYRIAYVDEDGTIGTACLDPREGFMVYSESIKPRPRYFVRTYVDADRIRRGSISDENDVRYFHIDGGRVVWDESHPHGFGMVPAVEAVMNSGRRGIYEDVLALIDDYNKVLSEKANDTEYFSDAYMKVLGASIDEDTIRFMRENRVINLSGKGGSDVVVDFLQRPSSDGTQEHLLDRLERLIFVTSNTCNLSDERFGTSSGIALRQKLMPMCNLALAQWRKMSQALYQYYRLVCASPVAPIDPEAWQGLRFVHTLNYTDSLADEAQTAALLSGITSRRMQLSLLSAVDDVDAELDRIREEEAEQAEGYATAYATNRTTEGGGADDEDATGDAPAL